MIESKPQFNFYCAKTKFNSVDVENCELGVKELFSVSEMGLYEVHSLWRSAVSLSGEGGEISAEKHLATYINAYLINK